ncbi:MAG TPA: LysR family transcriptional regulator substrate-binding protein, partial [Terriglobales bacterium]|nr:LysR family transcriptional regulator substrate-binding protein [Terriglobales bacterium]
RGGNTRRLIDQFFEKAGVTINVAMELSRLAAIKRMVEEDMGVGIVPLQSVKDEVASGRLVRWWIEGAQINWQLGLARLVGGYESPIHQTFLLLCREHFGKSASGQTRAKSNKKRKAAGS